MITDDRRACLTDVGLNIRMSKVLLNRDEWAVPSGWMFKAPEEPSFECEPVSFINTPAMDVIFRESRYIPLVCLLRARGGYRAHLLSLKVLSSKFPARLEGRGIVGVMAQGHVLNKPTEISDSL
jgi:hypothetical protein